jgi:uncharacterized protein YijF (DUF1287 family)
MFEPCPPDPVRLAGPRLERRAFIASCAAFGLVGCARADATPRLPSASASKLIAAARSQIGVTTSYDPAYSRLAYPGGDVDRAKGVCTDVLIRAYRDAFGIDLQRAVHEDMSAHFAVYPQRWGLRRPDRNIDHRRVPNLETYWTRQAARQPLPTSAMGWQPGDVFTMLIDGRLPHTGIVSDQLAANGVPLAIHNIGRGTQEEDLLTAYPPTGRFRWRI